MTLSGLRVLVYSGDHDRVLPTQGTEKWTSELGDALGGQKTDFAPWWRKAPETFGYQVRMVSPFFLLLLHICAAAMGQKIRGA